MGSDPDVLSDDRHIGIDDVESTVEHHADAFGEDLERVRAVPARVRTREEHAHVADGGGTEDGIADGMGCDIAVGCRDDPDRVIDRDTAERHGTVASEAVGVVSDSDSCVIHVRSPPA